MNARNLLNIALSVIAGGLMLLVVFAPEDTPPPAEYLLTGTPDSVQSITITNSTRMHFSRQHDHWYMRSPYDTRANDAQISKMLEFFGVRVRSSFTVDGDIGKYGLSDPVLRVNFDDISVLLGGTDPLKRQRYVLYQDTIALIDNDLKYLFTQTPENYLYRGLLPDDAAPVQLSLPTMTVKKTAADWQLTGSDAAYTQEQIVMLVDEWRLSQAAQITKARQSTGQKIEITLDNGVVLQYLLAAKEQDTVFIQPELGVQYHFRSDVARRLLTLTPTPGSDVKP